MIPRVHEDPAPCAPRRRAARERYEARGIPWRRGYLLYGPPGTGKTSLVTALASELSLNVCVLSLASPNVTDEKIGNLLASVPRRSVFLIEDVDAFFQPQESPGCCGGLASGLCDMAVRTIFEISLGVFPEVVSPGRSGVGRNGIAHCAQSDDRKYGNMGR